MAGNQPISQLVVTIRSSPSPSLLQIRFPFTRVLRTKATTILDPKASFRNSVDTGLYGKIQTVLLAILLGYSLLQGQAHTPVVVIDTATEITPFNPYSPALMGTVERKMNFERSDSYRIVIEA